MSKPTTEVAALLGSRICHDLISPLGAISNGVELLTMTGTNGMPEMELIAQSVEHANARIGFFRVAFGSASGEERMGEAELRQILDTLTRGSRMDIRWETRGDAARPEVKLAFLLINCLESAMPRGGSITVMRTGRDWKIVAEAERMRLEDSLWEGLSRRNAAPSATAAEVQFLLAPLVAAELGRNLTAELGDTGATIWF